MNIKEFVKKNWKIILAIVYVLLPFDIIPDILPAFGLSDDILVLLGSLLLSYLDYRKLKLRESKAEEIRKKHKDVVDGELVD